MPWDRGALWVREDVLATLFDGGLKGGRKWRPWYHREATADLGRAGERPRLGGLDCENLERIRRFIAHHELTSTCYLGGRQKRWSNRENLKDRGYLRVKKGFLENWSLFRMQCGWIFPNPRRGWGWQLWWWRGITQQSSDAVGQLVGWLPEPWHSPLAKSRIHFWRSGETVKCVVLAWPR